MSQAKSVSSSRIAALDYLRGFFIVVIIIDHLWKFPSLWTFVTGEARLWMTAAEGFVIISGFLIGYVRGYKGLKLPFRTIAAKLFHRGIMLYIWLIIATCLFAAIKWYVDIVPYVPSPPVPVGDWHRLIIDTMTLQSSAIWVFFLSYYAAFLIMAIGFVWLLRRRLWWVALLTTVALFVAGHALSNGLLKWQLVFFVPSLAGYYFPQILAWWADQSTSRRSLYRNTILVTSAVLLVSSVACTFWPHISNTATAKALNEWFSIDFFGPLRVALAFVWFVALGFVFDAIAPKFPRYLAKLLYHFGTHSLTAYICHGLVICIINTLLAAIVVPINPLTNTLIGAAGVLLVYYFIRMPLVARVVPR